MWGSRNAEDAKRPKKILACPGYRDSSSLVLHDKAKSTKKRREGEYHDALRQLSNFTYYGHEPPYCVPLMAILMSHVGMLTSNLHLRQPLRPTFRAFSEHFPINLPRDLTTRLNMPSDDGLCLHGRSFTPTIPKCLTTPLDQLAAQQFLVSLRVPEASIACGYQDFIVSLMDMTNTDS